MNNSLKLVKDFSTVQQGVPQMGKGFQAVALKFVVGAFILSLTVACLPSGTTGFHPDAPIGFAVTFGILTLVLGVWRYLRRRANVRPHTQGSDWS